MRAQAKKSCGFLKTEIFYPKIFPSNTRRNTILREVNKLSIGKTRGILYKIAKFLGDFSAVSSGDPKKIAKRVGRRTAGKATGKVLRKLFK